MWLDVFVVESTSVRLFVLVAIVCTVGKDYNVWLCMLVAIVSTAGVQAFALGLPSGWSG